MGMGHDVRFRPDPYLMADLVTSTRHCPFALGGEKVGLMGGGGGGKGFPAHFPTSPRRGLSSRPLDYALWAGPA